MLRTILNIHVQHRHSWCNCMQMNLCEQFLEQSLRKSLNLKFVTILIRHTRGILLFNLSAVHESVRSEHLEGHYSRLEPLSKKVSIMFGYNFPFQY
jgi:hypothetical protein